MPYRFFEGKPVGGRGLCAAHWGPWQEVLPYPTGILRGRRRLPAARGPGPTPRGTRSAQSGMPASRAAAGSGARREPDERWPRTRPPRLAEAEAVAAGRGASSRAARGEDAAGSAVGSRWEPPLSGAAGRSGLQPPPPLGSPGAGLARPHVRGRVAVLPRRPHSLGRERGPGAG